MLHELLGQEVVVDMRSPFVCLGTLLRIDDQFLELGDADWHDLRDTRTNRENYVAAARSSGILRNRQRMLLVRADVAGISRLADVVAG
jgi:hypothetical protein